MVAFTLEVLKVEVSLTVNTYTRKGHPCYIVLKCMQTIFSCYISSQYLYLQIFKYLEPFYLFQVGCYVFHYTYWNLFDEIYCILLLSKPIKKILEALSILRLTSEEQTSLLQRLNLLQLVLNHAPKIIVKLYSRRLYMKAFISRDKIRLLNIMTIKL